MLNKKTLKSFICIMLSALLLAVLPSCGNAGPEDTEAPETEPETQPAESTDVLLSGEGAEYEIKRSSYAETFEIEAAKTLNKVLKQYISSWPSAISEDFVKGKYKGDIIEANDSCEILVGNTNRQETQDAKEELSEKEFVVKFSGNKLIILGADEYSTLCAVEWFCENIIARDGERETLTLSRDYYYKGKAGESPDENTLRLFSWNLGCAVGVAADALKVICQYAPDILSLQESNQEIHNKVIKAYIKSFPAYKYAVDVHPGTTTPVYTPIIYNSARLKLVEAGVEWLDSRYTGTNTKSLCWAVFDTEDGKRFAMINFHGAVCSASYKGYEAMSDSDRSNLAAAWRLDNVRQVLDVQKRIYEKYGSIALTVNGDCNFNENSEPYKKLIAAGFADAEKTASEVKATGYKTSYSYGKIPDGGLAIDHIFGINGVYFSRFDIVRSETVWTAGDHCPIYADIKITEK